MSQIMRKIGLGIGVVAVVLLWALNNPFYEIVSALTDALISFPLLGLGLTIFVLGLREQIPDNKEIET